MKPNAWSLPSARRRAALTLALLALVLFVAPAVARAQTPVLTLTPPNTIVGVGGTMRYFAVRYANGPASSLPEYLSPSAVAWTSSNPAVLSISDGFANGNAPGTVTLTAQYQGLTAQTTATVAGEFSSHSIVTPDGRTRTYRLYTPVTYSGGSQTPLVLVFHGRGGSGRPTAQVTLMNAVAHQNGFLVAYPDALGVRIEDPLDLGEGLALSGWNGGGNEGYGSMFGIDDVEFTRRLIDDIAGQRTVNLRRVYATGFSNGASFTQRLGFELADRIAAIAPVAGEAVPGGDFIVRPPIRPVSVLEFHGTTDRDAPYFPAIPNMITTWLERNGISPSTRTVTYRQGIETCETYASSASSVTLCTAAPPAPIEVDGALYDGGGHAWPGGVRVNLPTADLPTMDINASQAIWAFFSPIVGPSGAGVRLVAAVLPSSRSVMVGQSATAFVTIINTGPGTATGVGISLATALPASFAYWTTDPTTNGINGPVNTPVDIPAGQARTFAIAIAPTAAFGSTEVVLNYAGTNTAPVTTISGVNTILLSASTTPVPDTVALAVTQSGDGIVSLPGVQGVGTFAVAVTNLGAGAPITASADTNGAGFPLGLLICQTNPATGQCLANLASTVTTTIATGATPTFAVFAQSAGLIAFDPAVNRIFVRFRDAGGVTRGSTSVAVRTQ
jgi:poly(3-hydroxybutyrate) depolymerase